MAKEINTLPSVDGHERATAARQTQYPTEDAYLAACRSLEQHRQRAGRAEEKLRKLAAVRDRLAEEAEYAVRHPLDYRRGVAHAVEQLDQVLGRENGRG